MFYKLSSPALEAKIVLLREKYGIDFVPAAPAREKNLPLLRVTKNRLILEHEGGNLFFHPSMALLRLVNIRRGLKDRFLQAVGIKPGDVFLDATLGLAGDSLIAAWALGDTGRVMAIEGAPLIYLLAREGLEQLAQQKFPQVKSREKEEAWRELAQAASRINTLCARHEDYLKTLPDSSVDVVYFDPMFRRTIDSSCAIKPLKKLSVEEPLSTDAVREACRVARRRVVMKERCDSPEFARLGFTPVEDGKYSSTRFGQINLSKTEEEIFCSR